MASRRAATGGDSPGSTCPPGCIQRRETFVQMKDGATSADDDGGRGDVHGVGQLVERIVEAIELGQEAFF